MLFDGVAELSQRLAAAGHHITVETAGTVWLDELHCDLISISPKLSHSTPHARDPKWAARHEAARWAPRVVQRLIETHAEHQLKFVVRWREPARIEADLGEIDAMLADLCAHGTTEPRVMLMPECTDRHELQRAYATLLPLCLERDWRLGERLHIHIFGDRPGT